MTRSGSEDNFLFNGNPSIVIAVIFLTVPDTAGQYVAARKEISTAILPLTVLILQNTAGTFHLGIINGGSGSGCEYGFLIINNYSFHITHNGSEIDTVFL